MQVILLAKFPANSVAVRYGRIVAEGKPRRCADRFYLPTPTCTSVTARLFEMISLEGGTSAAYSVYSYSVGVARWFYCFL